MQPKTRTYIQQQIARLVADLPTEIQEAILRSIVDDEDLWEEMYEMGYVTHEQPAAVRARQEIAYFRDNWDESLFLRMCVKVCADRLRSPPAGKIEALPASNADLTPPHPAQE